jgi:serine protease Do
MKDSGLGLDVTDITPEIAKQYNLEDTQGVIVNQVARQSKADEAGFQKGDIIREINHKKIDSVKDLQKIIENAKQGDSLSFYVIRPFKGITIIKLTK